MQLDLNKGGKYLIIAVFIACMILVSPMLSLRDNDVLGKIITVASIIALTSVHRIAGIIALIVVIAFMQNRTAMEGFELPKINSNPIVSATSSDDFFSWKTPDEFKQKYCMKGLNDDGWTYVLNPKIAPGPVDADGNPSYTDKSTALFNKIDFGSMQKGDNAKKCSKDLGKGKSFTGGIHGVCSPKCDWKVKSEKEGFTTNIENSTIQTVKNYVKDNVKNAKTMTESFIDRRLWY